MALTTSFNQNAGRVSMHGVRRELVERQAIELELPIWNVELPWPCSNELYEDRFRQFLSRGKQAGIAQLAFGDLLLADVRQYRINLLAGSGIEAVFPLWGEAESKSTARIVREMIDAGFRSIVTCVDQNVLPADFLGRIIDEDFLKDLPSAADPCGERGEYHSFCFSGPIYSQPIPFLVGEQMDQGQFAFLDLLPERTVHPAD